MFPFGVLLMPESVLENWYSMEKEKSHRKMKETE
jgi:hypothetical protein